MPNDFSDRRITCEAVIPAPLSKVWRAWTTYRGITSFFAPDCRVNLTVGGVYEILFDPERPEGQKGAEGMRILAIQDKKMLAFTWSAPPEMPEIRGQRTQVVLRLEPVDQQTTRVFLENNGYGTGEKWDEALRYFDHAWSQIVLKRLYQRFTSGPIDWKTIHSPQDE